VRSGQAPVKPVNPDQQVPVGLVYAHAEAGGEPAKAGIEIVDQQQRQVRHRTPHRRDRKDPVHQVDRRRRRLPGGHDGGLVHRDGIRSAVLYH
jgi:hypothetical protein